MKLKNKRGGFLNILLGASLLGNMLAGKGINRARERSIRAGFGSKGLLIKKGF